MFRFVFLFIVIMSALEIGVFMWLGHVFSIWFVVLGIILTGIIGAFLAKQQGLETLSRARDHMEYGRFPKEEIFDGLAILIGAILLFTPGFITDIIGFILLFPITRKPIKKWMKDIFRNMINKGTITVFGRWR
ncbi:UPF0716 protein FxsA [Salinibacillus kushneri]|uniref:UPF0716 protein FxsA n=1 Tax=Salinibacillus kushneri TaxID=237682 RepID=A0A1I0H6W9_9BACI|nr:FxsA family protein [Salinibacillus kushneri]SET79341.1 UPF0716 protein FxsA [Salinibacillus kushneri]